MTKMPNDLYMLIRGINKRRDLGLTEREMRDIAFNAAKMKKDDAIEYMTCAIERMLEEPPESPCKHCMRPVRLCPDDASCEDEMSDKEWRACMRRRIDVAKECINV